MTATPVIPNKKTFTMTAWEVSDKINSILKSNTESKVINVKLPKDGGTTLSVDLSFGVYLDELLEISDFFGDDSILISSFDDFDGISLFMQPKSIFWREEGGEE